MNTIAVKDGTTLTIAAVMALRPDVEWQRDGHLRDDLAALFKKLDLKDVLYV